MYPSRLRITGLCLLAALAGTACEGSPESEPETTPAAAPAETAGEPAAAPSNDWSGSYSLRGTLEGGRQVSGSMTVQTLAAGEAAHESTRQRVQRTYPSYQGPFYSAELHLAEPADTVHATFTCAHGPASSPPLVCEPSGVVEGLEQATLVVQPNGRAVLTGSHGEGVTVEFGRFSWSRAEAS